VKALVDVTKKLGFENVAEKMEIFNMGRKQD
jgi:hypothetical protein